MSDVMTRTLPIVLASTLALGGGFTLTVNLLLGGTVREAPLRVAPASQAAPSYGDRRTDASAYPPEAGNPRLWRRSESPDRRDGRRRRTGDARRSSGATTNRAVPAATAQPAPDSTAPTEGASPASPGAPARPAPARSEPAPAKPKRGGEDFYSTG
jgi:hypothetical protein